MNTKVTLMIVEDDLCICPVHKTPMMQIMDTFVCPSCDPLQVEDLNWVSKHIEERKKEGKQP